MNKTIVIGVGGTGLDALRAIRKLITENHGSLDAESVRNLGFLYLDTDPGSIIVNKDNKWKWEVLGKSIALTPSEYKIISAPDIASIVKDIDSYPQVKEWLPLDDLDSINKSAKDTPGASQIRPLGRFILTMSSGAVEAAFKNVLNRVPQAPGGGLTHVYIVCSLSGGTGSGMFLDLAYMINEWTAGHCKLFGFLVFPELTTNRGLRYTVNAYAALMELNYFSNANSTVNVNGEVKAIEFKLPGKALGLKKTPFEHCYIVGPRNNAGVELDLGAIPEMIAHRIYLDFDSSFSMAAESLLNNGKMERSLHLEDQFNGNLHSRNFYTFGLASIQYPIDQFLDIFSFKLSGALLDEWYRPKEYPGDINARVQGSLSELKLTDDYLLGDKDVFGSKHFDNFEVEVDTLVNNLKQSHPQKNIVPYLTKQMELKESEFRSVGILKYYQNKRADLNNALREVQKLLSRKISADLVNPELGYEYCEKILTEMIRLFQEKHKVFVDKFNGLPTKEKNNRDALSGFLTELTKNEDKWLFKGQAIKDSLNKIGEAMKANLSARIGLRAYELGIAFLNGLIESLETQKENLKNWRDALEKMKNELETEITKRITAVNKKIENVREFNGALLFSEARIEKVYDELDMKSALTFVEREILNTLEGGILNLPYSKGNIEAFYKAALGWLQTCSVYRISETNVADQLIGDYADDLYRHDLIRQNFNKSFPFLTIDESETTKGFEGGNYSTTSGTTNARLVGILNPEKDKSTNVHRIISDIAKATGIKAGDVKHISDRHQVLFLQEYTAFPLRVIRDLKTLKEQYEQYHKETSKPLPVHISKSFSPPLMDLFLTTEEKKKEIRKAEENFLFARALDKLKLEENVMQGKPEIRYRYVEYGTEKIDVLGGSWDEALENFLKDSTVTRQRREKVDKDLTVFLKGYNTKAKRDELWFMLDDMLKEIRCRLEYGDENPIYRRYNEIRGRIAERYFLYDESNPPKRSAPVAETGAHDSGMTVQVPADILRPTSADEEKFVNMVRTTMRNSKDGKLSPVMENMLKSNQKKYRVSDVRAGQIMEAIRAELFGADKSQEYGEIFASFFEDGEISEEERAILIERQFELGLTDEQIQAIESSIKVGRIANVQKNSR